MMTRLLLLVFVLVSCTHADRATVDTLPDADRLQQALTRGYVLYSDFGARGDGVTDDLPALVTAHEFANEHRLPVRADHEAEYYIGGRDLTAIIRTDTYFGGATFIIDDRNLENERAVVFQVRSFLDAYPVSGIASLTRYQEHIGITLDQPALLIATDTTTRHFIRFGNNQNDGSVKRDVFIADASGQVDPKTPILWDFEQISRVTAYPIDGELLRITGGRFVTIANQADTTGPYHDRGISINRSRVLVDGIRHEITGEGPKGAPYVAFLSVRNSAHVTVQNAVFTGRKTYYFIGRAGRVTPRGTYGINVGQSANVTFRNVSQTNDINDRTYWGLMGSNFSKNITMDGVSISRFDAHQGVANATIRNSSLGHQGINTIGYGTFILENSRVFGLNLINLRTDYGSTWEGEIIIRNTTFIPAGGGASVAHLIGGYNSGHHDFGYTTHMPRRILIENLFIDDANHGEGYQGPAIFANFNPERTDPDHNEPYAITLTEEVEIRNVTTSSGMSLRVSDHPFMFNDVCIITH